MPSLYHSYFFHIFNFLQSIYIKCDQQFKDLNQVFGKLPISLIEKYTLDYTENSQSCRVSQAAKSFLRHA